MQIALVITAALTLAGCNDQSLRPDDCAAIPPLHGSWPYDRLERVAMEDVPGGYVIRFNFDVTSRNPIAASFGNTKPPFVERAFGEPIDVGGERHFELVLDGLSKSNGERLRLEAAVVREVVEVEPEAGRQDVVRWVIGTSQLSCPAVSPDAEKARIDIVVVAADESP